MLELRVESLEQTHAVAAVIASLCRAGDVIVLDPPKEWVNSP